MYAGAAPSIKVVGTSHRKFSSRIIIDSIPHIETKKKKKKKK